MQKLIETKQYFNIKFALFVEFIPIYHYMTYFFLTVKNPTVWSVGWVCNRVFLSSFS